MKKVVSGIRSTGRLHLGNYFGAMKNFVKMQYENECFFFIADYHSLTTHPTPANLKENVRTVLAEYIACGLDPEKCTLYVQSDLPQTAELYLLLNMNAYVGELERSTTYKDKISKQPDNINAGLFTYPVLMAADILIHRADYVPVGKDQEQHLEMTRTFGNRFNRLYKTEFFPEPVAYNFGAELVKVPGLDGTGKMGKSEGEGNAIFLSDPPEVIRKKVMRAVTETDFSKMNPIEKDRYLSNVANKNITSPVRNLLTLLGLFSTNDRVAYYEERYQKQTLMYGELKKELAEDIIKFIAPYSEKIKEYENNDELLKSVMKKGKEKASESADKTMKAVREIIGFSSDSKYIYPTTL